MCVPLEANHTSPVVAASYEALCHPQPEIPQPSQFSSVIGSASAVPIRYAAWLT